MLWVSVLWTAYNGIMYFNPLYQSLLIGTFRLFTFNVISDVRFNKVCHFIFVHYLFPLFFVFVIFFLTSYGLLEHF